MFIVPLVVAMADVKASFAAEITFVLRPFPSGAFMGTSRGIRKRR